MSTSTLLLNSVNRWLADGTQVDWDFSFAGGYIARAHVRAYYVLADDTKVTVPVTAGMFVTDFRLRIEPAVPVGATLTIYRDTPKDLPLVDWQSGTALTEVALDTMARQAVFIAAEAVDASTVIVKGDLEGIEAELAVWKATEITPALTALSTRVSALESWRTTAEPALTGAVSSIASLDSALNALDLRVDTLEGSVPDTSEFGFKAMKLTTYSGASSVTAADLGRGHVKADNTNVTVGALATEFFCNILNVGTGSITVTFPGGDTVYKQGDTTTKLTWTLPANQILSVVKVTATKWFISGGAT